VREGRERERDGEDRREDRKERGGWRGTLHA